MLDFLVDTVFRIGVALLFLFGIILFFQECSERKAHAADSTFRTYYMKYGGMPCAEMEVTPCGITLRKCVDARIYLCLHDVAYDDKSNEP